MQQVFKEKLVPLKTGKSSGKKATAHIKQMNTRIQDLSEDIGELETNLLILRHMLPAGNSKSSLLCLRNTAKFKR